MMNEADLLIVLGASFANHTGIYAGHPIIQVDFDPMQLGKFHAVAVPVLGGVGVAVALLRRALGAQRARRTRPPTSRSAWAIWRAEKASRAARRPRQGRQLAAVFASLSHVPRQRRDRRRRRQPRLLVRPLLRVQAARRC